MDAAHGVEGLVWAGELWALVCLARWRRKGVMGRCGLGDIIIFVFCILKEVAFFFTA